MALRAAGPQQQLLLLLAAALCAVSSSAAAAVPPQLSKPCASGRDTTQNQSYVSVPGTTRFMPIFASVDLAQPLAVDTVLVMVHGIGGDANVFFCDALDAVPASVGVITPWFGDQVVRLDAWAPGAGGSASNKSLFWAGGGWNSGGAAAIDNATSSFHALDAVVAAIMAAHAANLAQSRLKQVVVAGFSAGGQLVQRYAWATTYGPPAGSAVPVPVAFVVSDPSTYVYFNRRRPSVHCRPNRDTGPDWSCFRFVPPRPSERANCTDYDQYRLGLENLTAGSPYFSQPRFAGALRPISSAYLAKSILYVFGAADTCNCATPGYDNPTACFRNGTTCHFNNANGTKTPTTCCDMPAPTLTNSFVDVTCGEMLQGSNRLQRGLLFTSFLRVYSKNQHTPQVAIVPGMGHDQKPMLNSAAFLAFVTA